METEQKSTLSSINTVILSFTVIGIAVGFAIGRLTSPEKKCPTNTCPTCTVYINENNYLKENSCRLYNNYKDLYLAKEELLSKFDKTWNGSVKQQEGYKSFSSWDSFKDKYCAE